MKISEAKEQIKRWEPRIHAFLEVFDDLPTDGKPIAIKDVICTKEGHTTAASKVLENFCSPYEATVISRLKKAGFTIIGKTNLDEFAMGASTEYSAYGPTKNPWDTTRVPGGSSGGSAAAVAAGEVEYALGTDTGGSVRHPASFCNVVGLRPTYGRVSRFGIIAYGNSLDQVGSITRTVKQSAELLEIIAGHDEQDATSSSEPVPKYTSSCVDGQSLQGIKIGVPQEYFTEGIDKKTQQVVKQAITQLENLGATTVDISLPLTSAAIPVYYLIAKAEASTNLARYDALRFAPLDDINANDLIDHYLQARGSFGAEVKRAILMGSYVLSAGYYDAWYKQASKIRTLIRREFEAAFRQVDIIAGPTTPETAFPVGAKTDDPLSMYLADTLTTPQSVAGVPAISVPCGFTDKPHLPVGLQLTAPPFAEEQIFKVAYAYEQSQNWYKQIPKPS